MINLNTARIEESAHTAAFGPPEPSFEVPRESLLDGFTQLSNGLERLDVSQLAVNTQIVLRTKNTEYRLTLLDPAARRVLVQGGEYFTVPAEATLTGSSVGGAMLKVGWIVLGLQVELISYPRPTEARTIVTSPVTQFYLVSA